MGTENIVEGPPLERSIFSSLGEVCFAALQINGDKVLQVSTFSAF